MAKDVQNDNTKDVVKEKADVRNEGTPPEQPNETPADTPAEPPKKRKKKPLLYPVLFMIIVSAVFTTALATLNAVTIDRIETQEAVKNQRSVLYVFDQDVPEDIEGVQSAFENLVETKEVQDIEYYEATQGDQLIGYAFPFQGSGLWGSIRGYVAVDPEFSEILGVDFLKHSETPGLGGRISEEWYRDQFRGIPITDDAQNFIVYRPSDGGNADAITGATLTSQAVQKMLNESLSHLRDEIKGEL